MVGDDGFGYELRQALAARGIRLALLVDAPRPTFTYTKLINSRTGVEDLPRIDFVSLPASRRGRARIDPRLEHAAPHHDCILVADQAETAPAAWSPPAVRECLSRLAAATPSC